METIKKALKSLIGQIIIAVISTIIGNFIVEKITKFNILKFLWEKLLQLLNLIWNFLNIKIAIWIYIVISIGLVGIVIVYLMIQNRRVEIAEPDFLKYREDKYKGRVKFRWEYIKDFEGKYRMENFIPICECGCQLDQKRKIGNSYFGMDQYVCPKCEKQYGNVLNYDEMQSFEKILISNVHSGEYKKIIDSREGE